MRHNAGYIPRPTYVRYAMLHTLDFKFLIAWNLSFELPQVTRGKVLVLKKRTASLIHMLHIWFYSWVRVIICMCLFGFYIYRFSHWLFANLQFYIMAL